MKLSNSSLDKYRMCPKMYDLHYNERIRPVSISSPLFFGSAIDQALNVLLLKKKKELSAEELELVNKDVYEVFDQAFTFMDYNGETIDLRTYEYVEFSKSDDDDRLLTKDDVPWSDNHRIWLSLRRKGILFLSEYEKVVMPNIVEVISIQRTTNLTNAEGDVYVGVIDFIATWIDGKTYIFDNKTSSKKYQEDSIKKSTQLMTYSEDTGINLAGYIVMVKALSWDKHNTCATCGFTSVSRQVVCPEKCGPLEYVTIPRVTIQVLLDDIDEAGKDDMFTDIQHIADKIKEGDFTPNTNTCHRVFGKKCVYFEHCRTGNMNGLVKIEKA